MESSPESSKKTSLSESRDMSLAELPIATLVDSNEKDLENVASTQQPVYPSVARQWSTLLVLNLAMMIDVVSGSALFVVVTHTASDLSLSGPDTTWM